MQIETNVCNGGNPRGNPMVTRPVYWRADQASLVGEGIRPEPINHNKPYR